ncbi:MAG: monofunctional biosynthetic peptidoglycan transglycosylase [Spirochaetota bacterium]
MKPRPKLIIIAGVTTVVFLFCFSIFIDISRLGEIRALVKTTPRETSLMSERADEYRRKKQRLNARRIIVPLENISMHLRTAILLAEDAEFYRHNGVDYRGLTRAIRENWRARSFVYGGSTITQQLAKNLYLSTRKTITRKISEFIYAKEMEERLSKKRILELYCNSIEWGEGVYGAEAAAQHYYSRSALSLTLEQSIRLAAIIINPRRFGPDSDAPAVAYRRRVIAAAMFDAGRISEEEFGALPFFSKEGTTNTDAATP